MWLWFRLHFANALFTSSSPDKGSTSGWKTGRSKTKRCIGKRNWDSFNPNAKTTGWKSVRCCFQILINCYCFKRKQPEETYISCETVTQHVHGGSGPLSSAYHQIRKLIQLTAHAVPTRVIIADKIRSKEFLWFSYLTENFSHTWATINTFSILYI